MLLRETERSRATFKTDPPEDAGKWRTRGQGSLNVRKSSPRGGGVSYIKNSAFFDLRVTRLSPCNAGEDRLILGNDF